MVARVEGGLDADREPGLPYVATIHHGIDFTTTPSGTRAGDYLLFVGRITEEKGIDHAIELARRSRRRLVVAAKAHEHEEQALFESVFERVETEAARSIQKALKGHGDPWEKARAGLRAFLEVVQEPRYRRIVIQEGPSVLGYERYREQEERSTFANVVDIVRAVLSAGPWELDEDMLQTFARIFFGAMSSAGESVSSAEDPNAAAANVETAIGFILAGFQALAESGVELPPGASGEPVRRPRG